MGLEQVPLTPAQLVELEGCESELVEAWLSAYADPPAGVTNPVGWFVAGVRSGQAPGVAVVDAEVRALERAERVALSWIRNVGAIVAEHELLDELYGPAGVLRHWPDDAALRARMLERWKARQHVGKGHGSSP